MPGFQSQSMNLAFYGGFTCFLESNRTERLSLSSLDPLSTKTTKAEIAPSPRCNDISNNLTEKKEPLPLLYSNDNSTIEEKTIKEPSLLLPEKANQSLWLWVERGRWSRSVQQ